MRLDDGSLVDGLSRETVRLKRAEIEEGEKIS